MLANFKDFIDNLILEELHPELQEIAASKGTYYRPKQSLLAKKIKELVSRGEKTGLEGNMPQGSSRAYLLNEDLHDITLDGKPAKMKVGTKVAIRARLDKYHDASKYGRGPNPLYLGALQNQAENDDYFAHRYRILKRVGDSEYESNKEMGIFPPLVEHDDRNHEYSQIGHARDFNTGEFKELTKHSQFPQGITHKDFCETLERDYHRQVGRYWDQGPKTEARLDKIEQHPLVQKFLDYHQNTGHPPHDYRQLKNLGVFEHPDGSKHIVARDHGFSTRVAQAYQDARMAQHHDNYYR
jgi:hypothetical protein